MKAVTVDEVAESVSVAAEIVGRTARPRPPRAFGELDRSTGYSLPDGLRMNGDPCAVPMPSQIGRDARRHHGRMPVPTETIPLL